MIKSSDFRKAVKLGRTDALTGLYNRRYFIDQLKRVMEGNPFPLSAAARTYFSLLSAPAAANLTEELSRLEFFPDSVQVSQDVIYTLYATKYSDSKFNNNFFERKLKVSATTRNFNTLSRLVELSA